MLENPEEIKNANLTVNLSGFNVPYYTSGTYYGTGWDTFEPTIGITSSGAIFFTNYNGLGDGTHIIRSRDQGQTWEDVGPFNQIDDDSGQTPNSTDPYLYVDKFNDKLIRSLKYFVTETRIISRPEFPLFIICV